MPPTSSNVPSPSAASPVSGSVTVTMTAWTAPMNQPTAVRDPCGEGVLATCKMPTPGTSVCWQDGRSLLSPILVPVQSLLSSTLVPPQSLLCPSLVSAQFLLSLCSVLPLSLLSPFSVLARFLLSSTPVSPQSLLSPCGQWVMVLVPLPGSVLLGSSFP